MKPSFHLPKPSGAFTAATYASLFIGAVAYIIGLWNSNMALNERGYYFVLLAFGLFSAVTLQKSVRDRTENIPVSNSFIGIAYFGVALSLLLLAVGLWNATLQSSEKGFYAMSFVLALFSAVSVQKNIRDGQAAAGMDPTDTPASDRAQE